LYLDVSSECFDRFCDDGGTDSVEGEKKVGSVTSWTTSFDDGDFAKNECPDLIPDD